MTTSSTWFIHHEGKPVGPFDAREVQRRIDSGELALRSMICEQGTENWQPASARFSKTKRAQTGLSGIVSPILLLLLLGTVGAFFWKMEKANAAQLERTAAIEDRLREASGVGEWAPADAVPHECFSDRSGVTCTFTNIGLRPVHTCSAGSLQNKNVPALRLQTIPLCTGRLEPGETRAFTAPWSGGFADDICSKDTAYGSSLDWSKCTFSVAPLDLNALRKGK